MQKDLWRKHVFYPSSDSQKVTKLCIVESVTYEDPEMEFSEGFLHDSKGGKK